MTRRSLPLIVSAAALLLASAPPVPAPGSPAPEESSSSEQWNFARDRKTERMTVPVTIDGKGPYNFLVDTGAERTVISSELARELSLNAGASAKLHSMTEVGEVGTVVIPRLKVNTRTLKGINAPALSREDLGAEGMLGVDSLQSQRVLFDFKKQTMKISPSAREEESWDGDTIVVKARSKFGHLILADARVDGQKVWVILDTGSEVSIGNAALRKRLVGKKKLGTVVPIELISVTGGSMPADYTKVSNLVVGGLTLTDMPLAFAEVHPFKKLGLTDRPALLLGMDALQVFDRVSVDFANRRVRFILPDQTSLGSNTRMAALR